MVSVRWREERAGEGMLLCDAARKMASKGSCINRTCILCHPTRIFSVPSRSAVASGSYVLFGLSFC